MNIGQWYSYNGTPTSSTTSHKAGIDVMVVSQNEINRTSLVRVRPWIMKLSGSGFWNYTNKTMTIEVNNSEKTTKTKYDFRDATVFNQKYFLKDDYPFFRVSGSGSLVSGAYVYDFTIKHNDDGTKTIPVYALIPLASTYGEDWTVDIDLELPDIPVANTVSYSYTTFGNPITINIKKANESFTTTLGFYWQCKQLNDTYYGSIIAQKTNEDQVIYTIPETLKNQILSFNKDRQKFNATLEVDTYSGDSKISTKEYNFVVPLEETKPIVSATFVDTNATTIALTGDSSKIVKYISKPKVTITAQAQQQADILSYSTVWGNSSSTAQETTFNSGIDGNILTVSAKDSRNWVGEEEYDLSALGKYIEYIKPNFSKFTLSRPESTSNTINADLTGFWFNNSFGATSNTLELKYRYKEKGGEYGSYQTITLTTNKNNFSFNSSLGSSFDYQKQYDFEFVLTDKLMSVITTFNVESGESIVRIAETYVRILGDLTVSGNLTVNNELINKQIGDVVITSTNENPSSRLGGTWELIDKEFKSYASSSSNFFNANSTNCELNSCYYTRSGHLIQMRLNYTNKVSLGDTNLTLGTFDFDELGVTAFPYSLYNIIGATDGGNALLTTYINYSTGILTHVESTSTVAVNNLCYLLFEVALTYDRMLDSFCDKFYWKRTA